MSDHIKVSLSKEEVGRPAIDLQPSTLVQNQSRPITFETIPGIIEIQSRNLYLILDRVDDEISDIRKSFIAWLFYADSDDISSELQRRLKESGNFKNPLPALCQDGRQTHFPKINLGNVTKIKFETDNRNRSHYPNTALLTVDNKTQLFTRDSITNPSDRLKKTDPKFWKRLNLSIPCYCFKCIVTLPTTYGQSEVPFLLKAQTDNSPDIDLQYLIHVVNYERADPLASEYTSPYCPQLEDNRDYIKTHLEQADLVITTLTENGVLDEQEKLNLYQNQDSTIDELIRILESRENGWQSFIVALEENGSDVNRQIAERIRLSNESLYKAR